jgi:ABC-2 type transport system permease protein
LIKTTLALTAAGMVMLYSLWIVLIALNFWATRLNNAVSMLGAFSHAGRFPMNVYPGWLRALLTFVIPIGIATNVPIQSLRGDLSLWQALGFLAIAALTVIVSAAIWRAGCRCYASASS